MKLTDAYFSRYFLYKLAKHKVLLIVSLVANILALPLMAFIMSASIEGLYNLLINSTEESRMSYEFEQSVYQLLETSESSFVICVLVFGILAVISLITPTIIMSYNHRRSDSDMYLSLPISTKGRFFADAIVGAVISVLPLILNFFGGLIFIGKGADIISKFGAFTKDISIPGIANLTVRYPYDFFIFTAIIGITVIAGIYFSSLFFTCCTGKKASSIIFSVAAPAILAGIGIYLSFLVKRTAYGIIEWEAVEMIPGYIAPLGMLKTGWDKFYEGLVYISYEGPSVLHIPLSVIIAHIATCILFFFGAYLCTVKRKAEKTGRLFVIEFVYKIIITLFVVFMIAMTVVNTAYNYSVNIPWVMIAVAIALVIYLAIQLPHYKSIKKLPKLLLHFGVTAAVSFTAFVLIAFSGGLGAANYIPPCDEIESVEVLNFITGGNPDEGFIYTDKKDIELITSLHKRCAEEKTETGYTFDIEYKLKNGETVKRSYIDDYNQYAKLVSEIRKGMLSSAATIEYMLPSEEDVVSASGFFALKDGTVMTDVLSIKGILSLFEAIRLDFEAGTLCEGEAIGNVCYGWTDEKMLMTLGDIFVRENTENILKVLKDESNYVKEDVSAFYDDTSKISPEDRIFAVIGDSEYDYGSKTEAEHFLYVRNKDLENEKVKELMSLIDFGEEIGHAHPYIVEFDKAEKFSVNCGIKEEDIDKASALIAEIKAEREKNNDKVDFSGFGFYMW